MRGSMKKRNKKNGKNSGCSSGGSAWGMRAGDDAAGGRDTDIRADPDARLCGGAVQRAETDECDKKMPLSGRCRIITRKSLRP